jgi:Bacteriophage Lambda NinG protein
MIKKKKKITLTAAKKKAWSAMSKYIRVKYSHNGFCSCVTCGWTGEIASMQAGHWIPKAQGNAIFFEETNVHPQCYRCNMNLGGNGPEYYSYMLRTYGQSELDRLKALAKTTVKYTVADYQAIEAELLAKTRDLFGD